VHQKIHLHNRNGIYLLNCLEHMYRDFDKDYPSHNQLISIIFGQKICIISL